MRCANEKFAFNDDRSIRISVLLYECLTPTLIVLPTEENSPSKIRSVMTLKDQKCSSTPFLPLLFFFNQHLSVKMESRSGSTAVLPRQTVSRSKSFKRMRAESSCRLSYWKTLHVPTKESWAMACHEESKTKQIKKKLKNRGGKNVGLAAMGSTVYTCIVQSLRWSCTPWLLSAWSWLGQPFSFSSKSENFVRYINVQFEKLMDRIVVPC